MMFQNAKLKFISMIVPLSYGRNSYYNTLLCMFQLSLCGYLLCIVMNVGLCHINICRSGAEVLQDMVLPLTVLREGRSRRRKRKIQSIMMTL